MTQFTMIQENDKVLDRSNSKVGTVTSIDRSFNKAIVKLDGIGTNEIMVSKLFDLEKISEVKRGYNPNKWFEKVKEFHVAFDHPVANKPTSLTLERATDRSVWIVEEVLEHLQQSSDNVQQFEESYELLLKGMEKAKEKSLKDDFNPDGTKRIVGQADALIDAIYFIIGSLVEMNVDPDPLFDVVQRSNMSKLFTNPDGSKYAKYREEDGKILKSPEFFPPEPALKKEILRQLNNNK